MLKAFRPARALKTSLQGNAADMKYQIVRLGSASPLAPHQQELIRRLRDLAQAFKGTVLDAEVSGERFEPGVEATAGEVVRSLIGSIIESTAEKMKEQQTAERSAAGGGPPAPVEAAPPQVSQVQGQVQQMLISSETTVEKTALERTKVQEKERPAGAPLNLQVKTSELKLVLQREAKTPDPLQGKSGPLRLAATQTGQHTQSGQAAAVSGAIPGASPIPVSLQNVIEKRTAASEGASGSLLSRYEKAVKRQLQKLDVTIDRAKREEAHSEPPKKTPVAAKPAVQPKELAGVVHSSTRQVYLQSLLESTASASNRAPAQPPTHGMGAGESETPELKRPQPAARKDEFFSTDAGSGTGQQAATSMAQQIGSLFEPEQPPASEIMPERPEEKSLTFPEKRTGPQQAETDAQGTTTSRGALPEEIATAVRWLAEEEVEQRLVEILSRQAKLRGIDLS